MLARRLGDYSGGWPYLEGFQYAHAPLFMKWPQILLVVATMLGVCHEFSRWWGVGAFFFAEGQFMVTGHFSALSYLLLR